MFYYITDSRIDSQQGVEISGIGLVLASTATIATNSHFTADLKQGEFINTGKITAQNFIKIENGKLVTELPLATANPANSATMAAGGPAGGVRVEWDIVSADAAKKLGNGAMKIGKFFVKQHPVVRCSLVAMSAAMAYVKYKPQIDQAVHAAAFNYGKYAAA